MSGYGAVRDLERARAPRPFALIRWARRRPLAVLVGVPKDGRKVEMSADWSWTACEGARGSLGASDWNMPD